MSYLRIDDKLNIIESFERAHDFLIDQKFDLDLKWFVIAFHHAIHNLMLFALKDSAQGGIWVENKKQKLPIMRDIGMGQFIVDVFNEKNKLLGFMKAFEFIQDKNRMGRYQHSKSFSALPYHKTSMEHLNEKLRNKFVHYAPLGWSIGKVYIYEVCKPIIEVADFLIFQSGQCLFNNEDLKKLKVLLKEMNSFFISQGAT